MDGDSWQVRVLSGLACLVGGMVLLVFAGAPDAAYAADAAFAPLRDGFFEGKNVAPASLVDLELGVALPLLAGGFLIAGACFLIRSSEFEDRAAFVAGGLLCPLLAAPALSASHLGWVGRMNPWFSLLLDGGAILLVLAFALFLLCAVLGTREFFEYEAPAWQQESGRGGGWTFGGGDDGCGGCGDCAS
jgi:hypothetical protein